MNRWQPRRKQSGKVSIRNQKKRSPSQRRKIQKQ